MVSFTDITSAVRSVLERATDAPMTAYEVLDALPIRDALLTQLARNQDVIGARFAAAAMVRDALAHLGAETEFAFRPDTSTMPEAPPQRVHIVYRLPGENR